MRSYALHLTQEEQPPVSDRSWSRFRERLLKYEKETGIDLMKAEMESLAQILADHMQLKGNVKRMDSLMVASRCKRMSRLEIIYSECNYSPTIHGNLKVAQSVSQQDLNDVSNALADAGGFVKQVGDLIIKLTTEFLKKDDMESMKITPAFDFSMTALLNSVFSTVKSLWEKMKGIVGLDLVFLCCKPPFFGRKLGSLWPHRFK